VTGDDEAGASGGAAGEAPDGIERRHIDPTGGAWRNGAGLVVFSVAVVLSLFGVYGREHTVAATDRAGGVRASVHLPEVLRNGEFFEMQFRIEVGDVAVEDLTIAVDASVWRDITVNTFIPAATEESSEDEAYRFAFGPMEAGSTFVAKVDAQVNPDILGANRGVIGVYDGEQLLLELPIEIGVLP
jgi:hypothetical protein